MTDVSGGKRVLTPFLEIRSGLETPEQLASDIQAKGDRISACARGAFEDESFVTSWIEEDISFVMLSVEELGLKNCLTTDLTDIFCRQWSEVNLQGQRIGLCRMDDGPRIRIAWSDQPEGTVAWCATHGLKSAGFPAIWIIGRREGGPREICAPMATSIVWDNKGDGPLIFRLLTAD